jgi:phage tail tape-measure protein
MSSRSSEPRRANRGANNTIIVLLALLLAGLSAAMPKLVEFPSQTQSEPRLVAGATASGSEIAMTAAAPAPRGLFVQAGFAEGGRSYHPSFGTSDSAGALGFWILISLCGALLVAGFGPWLVQWLRRRRG